MTKKKERGSIQLPMAAGSLLPHRPPMLFVENLLLRQGDRASGQAILPLSGIGISQNRLLPEYFIELIAQTAAMANGYDAIVSGEQPANGMLVGIDSFSYLSPGHLGRSVRIDIDKTFEFGAIKVISGEIYDGDELLVTGAIKVWEDQTQDEEQ